METTYLAPVIGIKIKEARLRAGLSTSELAERLGVTRQAISKWERGDGAPTKARLAEIKELLNIPSFFDPDMSEPSYDQKMMDMTEDDFMLFSRLDEICPEITNEALHMLFEFTKFLKEKHKRNIA